MGSFGAWLNHLFALMEDPKTKALDRQKLRGSYLTKWSACIACALLHDILKAIAVVCKCFQAQEMPVVSTIQAILRTSASMGTLNIYIKIKTYQSIQHV